VTGGTDAGWLTAGALGAGAGGAVGVGRVATVLGAPQATANRKNSDEKRDDFMWLSGRRFVER
jgi:hypothetical protein